MKNEFSFLKIPAIIFIVFASCKKPVPELAVFVPKDAATIFVIDPKAITDKLSSSGITIDSFANLFEDKSNAYSLRWNDIKNSGIDLNSLVFTFKKESNS